MEPEGGPSGVKPVDVDLEDVSLHDIDSSELSVSKPSNTTLPQLEATDAEKALNEEERKKRKCRQNIVGSPPRGVPRR